MSSLNSGLNQIFGTNSQATTNSSATGTNATTGTTANTYGAAGQPAVQSATATGYQNLLNGNVPTSLTAPAPVTQAYNTNFQNNVEPGLVSEYGAGSPQIASQNALGLTNLLGQTYNTGIQADISGLSGAANYGTTATGATNTGTGATTANGTTSGTASSGTDIAGSILALLASLSDMRLKKDILDLEDMLGLIKKLHPVRFKWNDSSSTVFGYVPGTAQIGFIAQEVADVIPEAVEQGHLGYFTLDKTQVIPVLVKAVQQLLERIEKLEAKEAS